jgi:general stress protein YciG
LTAANSQVAKEETMANGNSVSKRGFASMSPEKQREIASKGGKGVPSDKRTFSQNRDLAAEAGRKGGQKSRPAAHG